MRIIYILSFCLNLFGKSLVSQLDVCQKIGRSRMVNGSVLLANMNVGVILKIIHFVRQN